jgi:hypothetical protein
MKELPNKNMPCIKNKETPHENTCTFQEKQKHLHFFGGFFEEGF